MEGGKVREGVLRWSGLGTDKLRCEVTVTDKPPPGNVGWHQGGGIDALTINLCPLPNKMWRPNNVLSPWSSRGLSPCVLSPWRSRGLSLMITTDMITRVSRRQPRQTLHLFIH